MPTPESENSKEETKVIVEDDDGNWIQVHFDKEGNPEWYDMFLVENVVCISMSPESFDKLKELFRKLMNYKGEYIS